VVHFNVTAHPTAEWTAQQLREAFPFDQIPRYLLRDRDRIFGDTFREQVSDMQIEEVLSAPRSPWQRAYIERVIGSIRRECLDHVIVFGESSLRRTLSCYFSYYHRTRPHLSLQKDAPEPQSQRQMSARLPGMLRSGSPYQRIQAKPFMEPSVESLGRSIPKPDRCLWNSMC
jgi:transposase InsO family protein